MQSIKNTGVTVMLLFLSYGVYQVIMKPMPEHDLGESVEFSISDPQTDLISAQVSNASTDMNQALQIPRQTQPLRIDFANQGFGNQQAQALNPPSQIDELPPSSVSFQPPEPSSQPTQLAIPNQLLELPEQLDQQLAQLEQRNKNLTLDQTPSYQLDPIEDTFPAAPTTTNQNLDSDFVDFQPSNTNSFQPNDIQQQPQDQLDFQSTTATGSTNQFNSIPNAEPVTDQSQFESEPLPAQQNFETIRIGATTETQPLSSDTAVVPTGAMTNVAPRDTIAPVANALDAAPVERPALPQSWSRIESLVNDSQYQAALTDLSRYYHDNELDSQQRQRLLEWLDALAAKVIYSTEHHLRSLPYVIQPGDTIATLARDWQVPAQLIYNVNTDRIPDPNDLRPGTEIKLIQGPFDAEIDSANKVMTLFLDNMYAGRFAIGGEAALTTGDFRIVDKSAADKAGRPYWIELNNGVAIYGSNSGTRDRNEIAMNPVEAEELFSILSATSNVKVVR